MTSTTSRLLLLLSLLQARRDWPGQILADRLEISHRTVRRDVERLRSMGYSIQATKGPAGGYRLDAGAELPPLLFDDDQVVALALALQTAAVTGVGIEEAAGRALTTVRQVMPSRLRHRLDALQFAALPARLEAGGPVAPEVLIGLSAAVRARQMLRFDYRARQPGTDGVPARSAGADGTDGNDGKAVVRRRVEPHYVVTASGRWYLVAWDLDRSDWRIFRADRITPLTPGGPRFAERPIPGGSVHDFLSARFKGSDSTNAWPCTGTVILHQPAAAVVPFAGDGTVEVLGPDSCRLTAGSWSWTALAASFGRFDADLDVVGPPELSDAFGRLAARFSGAVPRA